MATSRGELLLNNGRRQNSALENARAERDALIAQLRCDTGEDLAELDVEKLSAILQRLATLKYTMRNLRNEYASLAAAPESA